MKLQPIIARIFLKARGDTGTDPSRGPLSDRIRDAALRMLAGSRDSWCVEVGVGEGLVAEELLARGVAYKVVGMDLSRDSLVTARRRLKGAASFCVVCGRGDRLPFKAAAVGRVVCVNTLHNQRSWEEVRAIIRAACDLVAPEGSLVLDIRNVYDPLISLAYRFSTMIDPSTKWLPVRAYPFGRLKGLLRENGLRIKRRVGVHYPCWPIPSAYVIEAVR